MPLSSGHERKMYIWYFDLCCLWMNTELFVYLFTFLAPFLICFLSWISRKIQNAEYYFRSLGVFVLSSKRHSCTKLMGGMSSKIIFASTKTECDLVFVLIVTGIALTSFCAVNFVQFFHVEHHSGLLWVPPL